MSISGEKSLQRLIRTMQPTLLAGTYAFVTVPSWKPIPTNVAPLGMFREPEGASLILTETEAAATGLPTAYFCRGISLNIHSSLYAVGFLAAVSERLARAGMSINIVSAYYRDYIFVPTDRADEAIEVLKRMTAE